MTINDQGKYSNNLILKGIPELENNQFETSDLVME
jgi:hypothetical protein